MAAGCRRLTRPRKPALPPNIPMPAREAVTVNKEMGITHSEFLRLLPIALRHTNFRQDGDTIQVREEGRKLLIKLSPQQQRIIASIRIPVTHVEMEFHAYDAQQVDSFLQQFDNTYRRGGG